MQKAFCNRLHSVGMSQLPHPEPNDKCEDEDEEKKEKSEGCSCVRRPGHAQDGFAKKQLRSVAEEVTEE